MGNMYAHSNTTKDNKGYFWHNFQRPKNKICPSAFKGSNFA